METINVINASQTSSESPDEITYAWTLSNEYALLVIDHVLLLIEVLGFVGIVLVFLVARYLVKIEKKTGQ